MHYNYDKNAALPNIIFDCQREAKVNKCIIKEFE